MNRGCIQTSSETVSPIKPPDRAQNFTTLGEIFSYNRGVNLFEATGGGVVAYSAPFSFNIGGSSTMMLYVKEDGVVSFGQSLAAGAFAAAADLRQLNVPLIAPFYADLDQNSAAAKGAGFTGIVIQQGLADPFADAAGTYALADAKAALRITWYGFDVVGASAAAAMPAYVQLLLIDEGGGDFDFKIRAGAPDSAAANSPAGGIGGFAFGDNFLQYDTPYDASFAGTFAVRGGEIVSLASAVPEPSAWAMMLLGVGLAGAGLRRRPARPARAPLPA